METAGPSGERLEAGTTGATAAHQAHAHAGALAGSAGGHHAGTAATAGAGTEAFGGVNETETDGLVEGGEQFGGFFKGGEFGFLFLGEQGLDLVVDLDVFGADLFTEGLHIDHQLADGGGVGVGLLHFLAEGFVFGADLLGDGFDDIGEGLAEVRQLGDLGFGEAEVLDEGSGGGGLTLSAGAGAEAGALGQQEAGEGESGEDGLEHVSSRFHSGSDRCRAWRNQCFCSIQGTREVPGGIT